MRARQFQSSELILPALFKICNQGAKLANKMSRKLLSQRDYYSRDVCEMWLSSKESALLFRLWQTWALIVLARKLLVTLLIVLICSPTATLGRSGETMALLGIYISHFNCSLVCSNCLIQNRMYYLRWSLNL